MSVNFKTGQFEGPLDLLLQLVEQEKLDVSEVSLAAVAEQFVAHVNGRKDIPLEEVADFLVVAAKLMYIKSRLMFPDFVDTEMEEGPDLESQLRRYQAFVQAAKQIDEMWKSGRRSFARKRAQLRREDVKFAPPVGLTSEIMADAMRRMIARLEPLRNLPRAAVERAVNIQDKIKGLLERVRQFAKTTFRQFVGGKATRIETVVSFLALLELVKQRFVKVEQGETFDDIDIVRHPDAPTSNPLAESYI